jgi:hypothetical protein
MHAVLVVFAGLAVVQFGVALNRAARVMRRKSGNKTEKVSEQTI